MTADVYRHNTLEEILSEPRHLRLEKAARFGYYSVIREASAAYDQATGRRKRELARLINDLYHWVLYDPAYHGPRHWDEDTWKHYHRFYRTGALQAALRITNLLLNKVLEALAGPKLERLPLTLTTVIAFSLLPLALVLCVMLLPFPPLCHALGRWMDRNHGPESWQEAL